MSNNVFILLQFYVLHLIDGLAYINRFQKKTSDIDSRIVWPSLDECKGMNNSHSYKLSQGFLPLRKQIRPHWQEEARVSERKRRKPARLFTADSSAPMRIRMGAVLAADERVVTFAYSRAGSRNRCAQKQAADCSAALGVVKPGPSDHIFKSIAGKDLPCFSMGTFRWSYCQIHHRINDILLGFQDIAISLILDFRSQLLLTDDAL